MHALAPRLGIERRGRGVLDRQSTPARPRARRRGSRRASPAAPRPDRAQSSGRASRRSCCRRRRQNAAAPSNPVIPTSRPLTGSMVHWADFPPRPSRRTTRSGAKGAGPTQSMGSRRGGNSGVNEYEILLMLDPELDEERGNEIIARIRERVEGDGGKLGRPRAVGPSQARLRDRPQARRRLPPAALHGRTGHPRRGLARPQDHRRRHAPPRSSARQGRPHQGAGAGRGRVRARR